MLHLSTVDSSLFFTKIKNKTYFAFNILTMNLTSQETHLNFKILPFFSSFLNDIIKITKELKTHLYRLIGIEVHQTKLLHVTNNIYSIMEGCHKSF